jgi:hypothetical protein
VVIATQVRVDQPGIDAVGWSRCRGATDYDEWPRPWPIRDGRGDQGRAYRIVNALGTTEPAYRRVIEVVEDMTRSPEFQRAKRSSGLCARTYPRKRST